MSKLKCCLGCGMVIEPLAHVVLVDVAHKFYGRVYEVLPIHANDVCRKMVLDKAIKKSFGENSFFSVLRVDNKHQNDVIIQTWLDNEVALVAKNTNGKVVKKAVNTVVKKIELGLSLSILAGRVSISLELKRHFFSPLMEKAIEAKITPAIISKVVSRKFFV